MSTHLIKIDDMIEKIAQNGVFNTLDLKSLYHQVSMRPSDKPYSGVEDSGVASFQRVIDQII